MQRLFEDVKVDHIAEGGTDTFSMAEYREAMVLGIGVEGASNDVVVSDLTGDNVTLDPDTGECDAVAFTSMQVDGGADDDEFTVDAEADACAIVLRSKSRYRPVGTDDLDSFEDYDG